MKQIRPNLKDSQAQEEQTDMNNRVPLFKDYLTVYIVWLLALFIPGLHHFYLGNTLRGFKYFFTFNEVLAGWILDLFELHVLLQKSVQEHGHVAGPLYCSCCAIWCYCMTCCHCCGLCFRPKPANNEQNTRATEEMDVVVTAQPLDAV